MTEPKQFPYQEYQRDLSKIRKALRKTTLLMYLVLCAVLLTPLLAFWLYYSLGKDQLEQQFQAQALDMAQAQAALIQQAHAELTRRRVADNSYQNLLQAIHTVTEAHPRLARIQSFTVYGDELRKVLDSTTNMPDRGINSELFLTLIIPDSADDLRFSESVKASQYWYRHLPADSVPMVRACVPFAPEPDTYLSTLCLDIVSISLEQASNNLLKKSFFIALATTLVAVFVLISIMMHQRQYRLSLELLQKQRDLFLNNSLTDPLTGALNRRAYHLAYASAQSQLQRSNLPFSVITLDIDHFKNINDQYGHNFGDKVLSLVVINLQDVLRSSDHLARLGGEEFSIICNVPDQDSALRLAEKLRLTIAETVLNDAMGRQVSITASLGVSLPVRGEDMKEALKHADQALYQAKHTGRNRVQLYKEGLAVRFDA